MTTAAYPAFVYGIAADDVELVALLDEHLDFMDGEPAPYLLLYDFQEWAVAKVEAEPAPVLRLLARLSAAVEGGDNDVVDCVAGAFLEGLPDGKERGATLRGLLPRPLTDLLARVES